MDYNAIGVLAAALPAAILAWIAFRQRDDQSIEERQSDRINQLEQALSSSQEANDGLRKENYDLIRRNLDLERQTPRKGQQEGSA